MSLASTTIASSRAFTRYAFAVQYHGGNFLGFPYQGRNVENCIIYNQNKESIVQTDLRGIESVEGRLRRAFDQLGKWNVVEKLHFVGEHSIPLIIFMNAVPLEFLLNHFVLLFIKHSWK